MRTKIIIQPSFPLIGHTIPQEYARFQQQYNRIDRLLDDNPAIIDAVHGDLIKTCSDDGRESTFSSEQFLRMIVVKVVEGLALRDTIIRVADSDFLRNFTRIFSGKMMNFTALQTAMKNIREETWKRINAILFDSAFKTGAISGKRLRVDSTVCETNVHYPTDASLMWDCFRTASRLMRQCVEADAALDMGNRFHDKKVKRLYTFIATHAGKKRANRAVRRAMRKFIGKIEWICDVSRDFLTHAAAIEHVPAEAYYRLDELRSMLPRIRQVVSCARRVFEGETVPASDRIFSIFEPHTELLKRGKAHKPVEFGHMVTIGQTAEKFISYYCVEEHSRHDSVLGDEAIRAHKKMFGEYPEEFAADKNYHVSPEHTVQWEKKISTYSVGKKGRRDEDETYREHGAVFRLLQKFRAGCEGSISVLKRVFGLYRCFSRGFKSFASSIGSIVFCHNLIILSRLC